MTTEADTRTDAVPETENVAQTAGIYVGPDCTHVDARKRTMALEAAGVSLKGFFFRRRGKNNTNYQPEWDNVELGETSDNNYLKRIPALLKGVGILLKHRVDLRRADFIMARNFDMMFIAVLAKLLSGSKAKMVYDVPDIQAFFFGDNLRAYVFRFLERLLLSQTSLLMVTSPGYITGYFESRQKFKGAHYVWENKLLAEQMGDIPAPAQLNRKRKKNDPWIICWHGTLRCADSMRILAETAERLKGKVHIYMRGKPTIHPDLFQKVFKDISNVEFGGEYQTPDDLVEIYGKAHFNWCIDFFDCRGNAPLLLPNRVYQGGYLGVVPLTAGGQESARYVKEHELGIVLKKPIVESLVSFLSTVTWEDYVALRAKNYAKRDELFIETADDVRSMLMAIKSS